MVPVFVTLGSNIMPEHNLPAAVEMLAHEPGLDVRAVSRVYRSPAVGADGSINPDQEDFLNAAVLVETDLSIPTLKKDILRRIEAQLDRVRTPDKFAPRTIDLDIVLYGDEVLGLIIEDFEGGKEMLFPDPDITRFAHVALPLADIDPGFVHPVTGETLAMIAGRFRDAPGITIDPLMLAV
jgi:2-amino-4-hydroxy-6-hydroxymethyldihydropteridine diphosphokinase